MTDREKVLLKKYEDLVKDMEKYIEENPGENIIKLKYSLVKLKESLRIFNYSFNKNG